jgi:hypothetical protein
MFFNQPEYLQVMQLTEKQKQCLGAMFYANCGLMRSMVDGKMQYVGTSETVRGFTNRTVNSLIGKGAAVRDTFGFVRPMYENAYVRAIAAIAAASIAEAKIAAIESAMFARAERLTGDFVKDYADLLDQSGQHGVIREDDEMLKMDNERYREGLIAGRCNNQSLIRIFSGLGGDQAHRGYIDLYPQAMKRLKMALRAKWDFTTGFYSSKHDYSACITVSGDKGHAAVCVEDLTAKAAFINPSMEAIDFALDLAANEAEQLYKAMCEEEAYQFGGHEYELDLEGESND